MAYIISDTEKEEPIKLQDQLKINFEDLVAKNTLRFLDTEFKIDEKFVKNSVELDNEYLRNLFKQQKINVFFTEIENLFKDNFVYTYSEVFTKLSIVKGSNDKRDPIEQGAMHIDKIKELQFVIKEAVINKLIKELIENKIIEKGKKEGSFSFTKEVITELIPRIKKLKKHYIEKINIDPEMITKEEANKIINLFNFDIDEKDKKINDKYIHTLLLHFSRADLSGDDARTLLFLDLMTDDTSERIGKSFYYRYFGHFFRTHYKEYKKALEYYSKSGDSYWIKEMKTKIKNITHDFHSSRGLLFCKQCGGLKEDLAGKDCCKENNHQFQAMKEGGVWKPICKKCGITAKYSHKEC